FLGSVAIHRDRHSGRVHDSVQLDLEVEATPREDLGAVDRVDGGRRDDGRDDGGEQGDKGGKRSAHGTSRSMASVSGPGLRGLCCESITETRHVSSIVRPSYGISTLVVDRDHFVMDRLLR